MKRPHKASLVLWAVAAVLLGSGAWSHVGGEARERASVRVEAAAASPRNPPPQSAPTSTIVVPSGGLGTPLLLRLRSLLGLLVLTGLAWALSVDRSRVDWRVVIWGLSLQMLFAALILRTPVGNALFTAMNAVVVALLGFTLDGARFVFGNLVLDNVPVGTGTLDGDFSAIPGQVANTGAFFAFNVLPTIIFFCSLVTILYHLGVMQMAVRGFAWLMQRTMKTSGAETLSTAGNIFVGMTEAPLLVKPFIERMTMSELMAVMTGGFATVAGGVLAAYVLMLVAFFPGVAGHLMAASVMSAPAALVAAKLMHPETEQPETSGTLEIQVDKRDANVIDAAARGASEGLSLALNVGAMILAFVALIAMCNGILGWAGGLVGQEGVTLEGILGWLLSPLAWVMGVPWSDATQVGSLMGVKTMVNEFVAYLQLADGLASGSSLQPRSVVMATYALSGFANFASIAIQLGGIGGIAPSRRQDLSRLGLRAMVAGSIAAFMTATVAGILV